MTYQNYFPTTEAARIVWLAAFANKLPIHASQLGLSDEEVKSAVADAHCARWLMQDWSPSTRQSGLESSAFKHTMLMDTSAGMQPLPVRDSYENMPELRPAGMLPRIFNLVKRIKLSSGYSQSIGMDLSVIGGSDNIEHPVPEYHLVHEHGPDGIRIKVNFTKLGHDAVSIESRRNNSPWENLGIALAKPWYDERSLQTPGTPEIREYRLRWHDKSGMGTTYSPVKKITVGT